MKKTLLILCLLPLLQLPAQSSMGEKELKAKFVFLFTRFITWPEQKLQNNFKIHILGKSRIYKFLEKISADKKIHGLPVVVRQFTETETLPFGHIVIIPASNSGQTSAVINRFHGQSVLIISEKRENNASINFLIEDEKIRFEINRSHIIKSGLQVGSDLLKLATKVH